MNDTTSSDAPNEHATDIPPEYRQHRSLTGNIPYFTLPNNLIEAVVSEVGQERFDADLLEMEFALSDVCGDHTAQVGFWRGQPILYDLLRTNSLSEDPFLLENLPELIGRNAEEARDNLVELDSKLDWSIMIRRAYSGWLLTNPTFLGEQDQLLAEWGEEISQLGIPTVGPPLREGAVVPGAEQAQGRQAEFARAFVAFFTRWRLESMAAPLLPRPIGMYLPVTDLRVVLGHMRQGGTTFFLPDIYPVPSRDHLRTMLEDALRGPRIPGHLQDWSDIVRADNPARNHLMRWARIFQLQHFVRALVRRHPAAMRRRQTACNHAFATLFHVSSDTIERDIALIDDRLGRDWRAT